MTNWRVLIVLIIVTTIFCAGCLENNHKDNKSKTSKSIDSGIYEVWINTTENSSYEVLLPIPILKDNNDVICVIMEELKISGIETYEIINTTYGKAFRIHSNKSANIYGNFEFVNEFHQEYYFNEITLRSNNTTSDPEEILYWLYCNSSKPNLVISFHTFCRHETVGGKIHGYTNFEWEIKNYHLKEGWQEVNLYKEFIIIG